MTIVDVINKLRLELKVTNNDNVFTFGQVKKALLRIGVQELLREKRAQALAENLCGEAVPPDCGVCKFAQSCKRHGYKA